MILDQIKNKTAKTKRIGLVSTGPPARGHTKILDPNSGAVIGEVTSGCPSPTLGNNVAMGYVENNYSKAGTKVVLEVRKKQIEAQVAKMPFVKANYYNG